MEFQVSFPINNKIYLRDPESTDLGKLIVKKAIDLIYTIGFEQFTFKKLAIEIQTTEATIYRYFENKHRLLLYILNWYWYYMQFLIEYRVQNITNTKLKLEMLLDILTSDLPISSTKTDYNKKWLNEIVMVESSKVYLVKDVDAINKEQFFQPYKDLCAYIAQLIKEYQPKYKYPHSLSSTLIETSHNQLYFSLHLPRLTDIKNQDYQKYIKTYLHHLLFSLLA